MLTYRLTAVATATFVLLLTVAIGCGGRPEERPWKPENALAQTVFQAEYQPKEVTPADVAELVKGDNAFAFELYRQLCAENKGNLFVSPYSISTALAMTSAGARGDTLKEMETVLHFPPQDKLHPAFKALIQQMNGNGEKRGYQLATANALWGQKGHGFLPDFLLLTKDHYGAGLREVDFANDPEAARKTINQWVERETQDKIKELLKPGIVNGKTRLVLTNAIYFKGDWASPFWKDKTKDEPFILADGKKVKVPMMYQETSFKHFWSKEFQALEMPYAGTDLAMLVLLPKKADSLSVLEKDLTADRLAEINQKLQTHEISVYMPKFKATTEFLLNEKLKALGMQKAFRYGDADFSGMNGRHNLFISDVVHKAFVEVNEKGTEAAASSGINIRQMSEPPTFRVDHPFLFLIRDTRNGIVLFMGRICNPSDEAGSVGEGEKHEHRSMPPPKDD